MLKDLLDQYGLSPTELARRTKQSPQTINGWINSGIPVFQAYKARVAIGCSYDEIYQCQAQNFDLVKEARKHVELSLLSAVTAEQAMAAIEHMPLHEVKRLMKLLNNYFE